MPAPVAAMDKLILTLDGSRAIRDMLRLALSVAGYRVVQAEGEAGEAWLAAHRPDVVVADVDGPGAGGVERVAALAAAARARGVPILALGASRDPAAATRAREAGAAGWIDKPFDPARLLAAVRSAA